MPWTGINGAKGAKRGPVRSVKRDASVKPDSRVTGDQRIINEARVQGSVLDHHRPFANHRMGTERLTTRCLLNAQSLFGLEPLSITINERYRGNGNIEQCGYKTRNTIKGILLWRIEKIVLMELPQS
ncbi:MAG: hypothetical protein Devi2KO_28690 [Devosia indica]